MSGLPKGVRLAFDFGTKRIGVAASDASGSLASSVRALTNREPQVSSEVGTLIFEYDPCVVYVGNPVALSGQDSQMSESAKAFALTLVQQVTPGLVHLVDERFSSVVAQAQLREAGHQPSRDKGSIDTQAAIVLLQSALDYERQMGRWAGTLVTAE